MSPVSTAEPEGWDAFISYSRQDKDFVVRLAAALNAYRPPKSIRASTRPVRVFLDQHDIGSGDYVQEIEAQLARARMLIVVCTPAARASPYVDDEVQRFFRRRGGEAAVPVLLAGLANNEASATQADQQAFPPALAGAMQMPLAVDYRGFDVRRDRVQRGGFEGPWHQLLAKLLGVGRAEIEQREKRRQLVRWRWIGGSAGALVAVLATALVFTLLARAEAERQRDLAEQRRRDVQARALNVRADVALADGGQGLQRALLLTIESLSTAWTPEAQSLLLAQLDRLVAPPVASADDQRGPILALEPLPKQGVLATQGVDRLVLRSLVDLKPTRDLGSLRTPGGIRKLVASPDGRWLLAGCAEHVACVWDTDTWTVAWAPRPRGAVIAAAFSPDSRRLAYAFDGPPEVSMVEVGAWREEAPLAIDEANSEPIQGLAFSGDAQTLLVRTRSDLELHDLRTRLKLQEVATRGGNALASIQETGEVFVDDGTRRLRSLRLTRDAAGVPRLSESGEPRGTPVDTRAQTSIGSDGRTVAARTGDHMVELLSSREPVPVRYADGGSAIALAGASLLAVGMQDGRIELFDLHPGRGRQFVGAGPQARLALSRDGRQLAVTDAAGFTSVLGVADGRTLASLLALEGASPRFTADGRWLLVASSRALAVFSATSSANDWRPRWKTASDEVITGVWITPDGRWMLLQRAERLERIALEDGRAVTPIPLTEHPSELRTEPGSRRIASYSPASVARGFGLRQPSIRRVWSTEDGRALGWRSFEREDLERFKGIRWGRRAEDAQGEWTTSDGGGDRGLVDAAAGWPLLPQLLATPQAPDVRWLSNSDAAGKAMHEHALQRAVRAHGPSVTTPAWSANGEWLVTVGSDEAVRLWPLTPAALAAEACRRLRRNLDTVEWRAAFGDEPYRRTCPALPSKG